MLSFGGVVALIEEATRTSIQHALWDDHKLIKTYGPEAVLMLATEDLPIWTAALSAVPTLVSISRRCTADAGTSREIVDAIGHALKDAELTIDELDRAIVELVGPWAGDRVMPAFQELWPRWRQAVGMASHRGVLCFGLAEQGRRVSYTNPPSRGFQGSVQRPRMKRSAR